MAETIAYMSPEQARGQDLDIRTDLFSFGVVLYEMATGVRPFTGESPAVVFDAILNREPRPSTDVNCELPVGLANIISKALEKDRDLRYQHASEVRADLQRLKRETDSQHLAARGEAATKPRWPFARKALVGTQQAAPLRKRRVLAATAGVFVALAATLVGLNVAGLRNRLLKATALKSAATSPRIGSLAILPLENLSHDPEQEYFADGMTEELITDLGQISALRVISRTSVMRYKGTKKPLPEIARELNVDAIVEGTVQRSGNHVRITANLLYAPADRHLWAQTYERNLQDVLVLQGEVARSIAGEIRIKLMPQEQMRLASTRPVNPEAYQAYLQGKYYTSKWTEEGFKKAVVSFRQAIDLDPTYAPAYQGLADAYSLVALSGLQPSTEAYPLAKAAALKALELDDALADAHAALGQIKFAFDWDWSGAEQELKRAVMLNPNSSTAHFWYGVFLTAMGRSDEAVLETRKALELDPLTPTTNLQLGWVLFYAGRHDESIAQLKKTLELASDLGYANMELGWNYAQKRMYPEAVRECQRAVSLMPEEQVMLGGCGNVYGLAGRRQDALTLLGRLKKLSAPRYLDPFNVALLYDGLGDNGPTMDWLERAYRERSASLYALRSEMWSDRLRSDPRFQDLLQRMNFPA